MQEHPRLNAEVPQGGLHSRAYWRLTFLIAHLFPQMIMNAWGSTSQKPDTGIMIQLIMVKASR